MADPNENVIVELTHEVSYFSTDPGAQGAISQNEGYLAIPNDSGSHTNTKRMAGTFIYPDGSVGNAGAEKYFHPSDEDDIDGSRPKNELLPWLEPKLLYTRSSKMVRIIELVAQSTGKALISPVFYDWIYLLAPALRAHGYKPFVAKDEPLANYDHLSDILDKKDRYVIISSLNLTANQLQHILKVLNHRDNRHGHYIKAIIVAESVSTWGLPYLYRDVSQIHEIDCASHKLMYEGVKKSCVWVGSHDYTLADGIVTPLVVKAYRHAGVSNTGDSYDLKQYCGDNPNNH